MQNRDRWLAAGLFFTTLASLLVELLDSRLLSVLTWYHLSFLAISLAMLGGAAGAVAVFLAGDRLSGEAARRNVGRAALLLAVSIPITQLALMQTRIPTWTKFDLEETLPLVLVTVLLMIPFLLSGVVVTLALTRCGGRVGNLYGSDLMGAALGCLLIIPVLQLMDMLSAGLFAGALVAFSAYCYARFSGVNSTLIPLLLTGVLFLAAVGHVGAGAPIGVAYPRGGPDAPERTLETHWNAHSYITVLKPQESFPYYWGRGASPFFAWVNSSLMRIDGMAGTPITEWDGERESLDWVRYDVTSLPHHLRSGHAAVIGVGGGRDILSALWGGSDRVTAVELNGIFVDLLEDRFRDFAKIADFPGVRLVNDEGRSYMSRSDEQFDVLQMSLVDTWASTGAGAFTLSENALYTVEAWKTFLSRLAPNGIFSTSRWFAPQNVSETSRLLALCVRALLELGVREPEKHIVLVSGGKVATLLVSMQPFTEEDLTKIREVSAELGFKILAIPGQRVENERLAAILESRTLDQLAMATADPDFNYSAPTDAQPYFFNMLRPGSFYKLSNMENSDVFRGAGGVLWGNIRATVTLMVLLLIAAAMAALIILVPLAFSGLPDMDASGFGLSLSYFAIIGYGFMSIQIPLLQRFSVLLGHPIYTYSVILFAMILFAGIGSFLSERLRTTGSWWARIPVGIAILVLLVSFLIQSVVEASLSLPLLARALAVISCIAPVSLLLGFCFPLGLRVVASFSESATAWMWGVNGACGVIASILSVVVSMWVGIHANLYVAATLYLLLTLPAGALVRRSRARVA